MDIGIRHVLDVVHVKILTVTSLKYTIFCSNFDTLKKICLF